jgi:alanyl-tRNA synthetase
MKSQTGNQIRQEFIDFFVEQRHTFVPSASLVPGGDQTLLFTNAGMVQFKDVFLGTDKRPYTRAANSQKCMRVAGKHNDLEDVGQDDTHHTFFEMLGNWSFGDYYKREAITWAWQLLTEVWTLPRERLWATYFKDDQGDIPSDEEAAGIWKQQPGMDPTHILYSGRKDNFWEMAETGPCGPCSEIHYDRGPEGCNKRDVPGHVCKVNGNCTRYLEIWNLVFIQYNRLSPTQLEPLPAKHVDTGMGFDRIVSIIQGVDSNYRTDLFLPLIQATQALTGDSDDQRDANFTPYRVIADHSRTAAFLIADGVVPGNTGRNYVCRMIIRRAARFGSKLGLHEPFLADIASEAIRIYGDFYPELERNRSAILDSITREERRFQRTVESGVARLDQLLLKIKESPAKDGGSLVLAGADAFDLYATYGLPLEITRDIAKEQGLGVDEAGFREAMEEHRISSGAGEAFGEAGGEDVVVYRALLADLWQAKKLPPEGVAYDPYTTLEVEGNILAILRQGTVVASAQPGEKVEIILPETCFYVESGGQVSDTGNIVSAEGTPWEVQVTEMRKPAAGVIVHCGQVVKGSPQVGDLALAHVDEQRRRDIMRNHTATHLLHAELHAVLGPHARQAGSLVAPDRLRFDFTHPEALTPQQLEKIEAGVNRNILGNYALNIKLKPLEQAINEGAMALFGEKYSATVRTITIGHQEPFSYELCGGTHVSETGDIGIFLITSEGSVASGIRRIEAVTGRGAYELVQRRMRTLKDASGLLATSPDELPERVSSLIAELGASRKETANLRKEMALSAFLQQLEKPDLIAGVPVLALEVPAADIETLRQLSDRFRQRYTSGVLVLACVQEGHPSLLAAITDDLVGRGLHAGNLVKTLAAPLGGSGGGKPSLAQAGGKDASLLPQVLHNVPAWVEDNLKG